MQLLFERCGCGHGVARAAGHIQHATVGGSIDQLEAFEELVRIDRTKLLRVADADAGVVIGDACADTGRSRSLWYGGNLRDRLDV